LDDDIDKKGETVKELNDSVKILRQDLSKLPRDKRAYKKKSLKEKGVSMIMLESYVSYENWVSEILQDNHRDAFLFQRLFLVSSFVSWQF
jgi:hypothetical protein